MHPHTSPSSTHHCTNIIKDSTPNLTFQNYPFKSSTFYNKKIIPVKTCFLKTSQFLKQVYGTEYFQLLCNLQLYRNIPREQWLQIIPPPSPPINLWIPHLTFSYLLEGSCCTSAAVWIFDILFHAYTSTWKIKTLDWLCS